jgi:hypothetical protein
MDLKTVSPPMPESKTPIAIRILYSKDRFTAIEALKYVKDGYYYAYYSLLHKTKRGKKYFYISFSVD